MSRKNNNIKTPKRPNPFLLYGSLIILALFFFINLASATQEVGWLEFEQDMLSQNDVEKIVVVNKETAEIYIKPDRLSSGRYNEDLKSSTDKTGPHYVIKIGSVESFENKLARVQEDFAPENRVEVLYEDRFSWTDSVSWILPILIIIVFWMFILRRMRTGGLGGSMMNFGKLTAKPQNIDLQTKVSFDDVAGLKEAKIEIMEVVDFLKNPEEYTKLGAKIPKGILLTGPPGTGKTLLARAVAGEANVPFFHLSGSEFVEMFVGVGASRVRDLFMRAKKAAPAIMFIDEIDAVGRVRGTGIGGGNDEREQTLNQILVEMDGFEPNDKVIVMAATNRSDVLDPALLRPGRFDRRVMLDLPDRADREEILTIHARKKPLAEDVNLKVIAERTPGFSGAD